MYQTITDGQVFYAFLPNIKLVDKNKVTNTLTSLNINKQKIEPYIQMYLNGEINDLPTIEELTNN